MVTVIVNLYKNQVMAKATSQITRGLQGTLGELTFVHTRRYGKYARVKRGTIKPAVLNKKMKESSKRMAVANPVAKLFFDSIKHDHRDGSLWTRVLSIYRKQIKEGWDPDVQCLAGLECSTENRLDAVLGNCNLNTSINKNVMRIKLHLDRTPIWQKVKYLDGYQVSIIALFVNMVQLRVEKVVMNGPVVSMKSKPEPMKFEVRVPKRAKEYVLLMKVEGAEQGKLIELGHVRGMKVMEVGYV